jgi:hypothetical protein
VGGGGKKKGTSSASEVDDSGGEDSGEQRNPFRCRHCSATVSKDWHHGGKDMKLLCTGCRLHYKRYLGATFMFLRCLLYWYFFVKDARQTERKLLTKITNIVEQVQVLK